ncbi:hypothetical protein NFI00_000175 [Salmonella enterica]|nr:hypothetical protein [Salmonella enterica subsp. enterica serovar Minnesota]EJI5696472.1 hypothetical protein [Salmonella enterica]
MGALDQRQLFLDKFVAYNKQRYASEPNKVAAFDNLTLTDVQFGTITKTEDNGVYKRSYDHVNSAGRNFTSDPQRFNAANLASQWVTTATQMADIADVRAAPPGIYFYLDALNNNARTLCVVYPYDLDTSDDTAFKDQIFTMVNGACKYALDKSVFDIQPWTQSDPTDKMTYVQDEVIAGWVLTIKGTQDTLVIPDTDYGDLINEQNGGVAP